MEQVSRLTIGPVYAAAAQPPVGVERRQRAATALHDGILLLHAKSTLDFDADGFRQEPFFITSLAWKIR